MCIRDREALKEANLEEEASLINRVIQEQRDSDQQLKTAMTDAMAVSYTHLRAHETVLDLVCRLLLEKKKKNNQKKKKKNKKKKTKNKQKKKQNKQLHNAV